VKGKKKKKLIIRWNYFYIVKWNKRKPNLLHLKQPTKKVKGKKNDMIAYIQRLMVPLDLETRETRGAIYRIKEDIDVQT
jgi:hypothetical protein